MKTNNIFHLASVRLTTVYLLIIMLMSLVFSVSFYRVTSLEIERGIRRQGPVGQIIRTARIDLLEDFIKEQNEVIAVSKHRLRNNLILTNIFIFVSGGFLSYYFARRSLKPIEDAHEAQSRFTADASHELRTPITAMKIETELTLTEPSLTLEQAKTQLKSNLEELDKLTALSEGLLSLSKIEQTELEMKRIDLKSLLDQAVSRVQKAANKKRQTIVISKLGRIEINVNEQHITEAFVVILDNAVKYSPSNTSIEISASATNESIIINFQDQGQGIKASDLPHIFDRFYRADQSRTKNNKSNGYGIGLSIAKASIESHGGSISASSKQNKGSTFTVQLPLS